MSAIHAYFDNLNALLGRTLDTQQEGLETAARAIADCFRQGGMLYTFGTGHGHLLALEIFYRAGGMARVCPILDEKLMLHISAAKSTLEERDESWVPTLLEKYPIKQGDVLLAINQIPVWDTASLEQAAGTLRTGETVDLTIYRSGTEFSVSLTWGQ